MKKQTQKTKGLNFLAQSEKFPFDKYKLYNAAVQSADTDVLFYQEKYKEIFKTKPLHLTLREDFCAAGDISCEWVKLHKSYKSCGLDLDEEPMQYGRDHYFPNLTKDQQSRVVLIKKNVLEKNLPQADISVAVNFSYFIFKERSVLLAYFKNVLKSLKSKGLFVVDIFGGTQCTDAITDRTRFKNFTYYWSQRNFDPVTHEAVFDIHFKYKNKIYKSVFNYDWRMWTIPEVKDLMREAGFDEIKIYWEGTNRLGGGNGIFTEVQKGEACDSWIAYIVGIKR